MEVAGRFRSETFPFLSNFDGRHVIIPDSIQTIRIFRNSDLLSATHIGSSISPRKLNGLMDTFSFLIVTTHFISHARYSFIICAHYCVALVS